LYLENINVFRLEVIANNRFVASSRRICSYLLRRLHWYQPHVNCATRLRCSSGFLVNDLSNTSFPAMTHLRMCYQKVS